MEEPDYYIYILSDSIGATCESVARAAARQFPNKQYIMLKHPHVTQAKHITEIIKRAARHTSIVVFSTVLEGTRHNIIEQCNTHNVAYLDIMANALQVFESRLGTSPVYLAGISRALDDDYFKRIKAIEFAIRYDDGKEVRKGIQEADIILIGVSRTSKTPLSMYLAYFSKKVINIPLVGNAPVPDELFKVPSQKIIGLTIDPRQLNQIRRQRSRLIGFKNNAVYTDMSRILEELEFSEDIMKQVGCPIINVSNKAIEETANIILEIVK